MYDSVNFIQGTNFYMNLYCFLLYCFLLLISLRGNVSDLYSHERSNGRLIFLFCGMLLFSLTSFVDEDFFHYHELMSEYGGHVIDEDDVGIEVVYQYLIYFVGGDYFLFRLAVWGSALVVTVLAARRFNVNVYNTLFVVFAGFIMIFSYARASLAMAVFALGVAMVCVASEGREKGKNLRMILGLLVLASSFYFHRSMLPVIAVAICWVLIPYKEWLAKHSLWLFPILVAIFSFVITTAFEELAVLANSWNDDESGTLDKMEHYRTMTSAKSNINGYITLVLKYSSFYVPFFVISNLFRSERTLQTVDKRGLWLYLVLFLMMTLATSFLFVGFDSSVLFYRYIYMVFIPLSILVAYLKNNGVLKKSQYLLIVGLFIINALIQLFAAVYSEM